MPHHLLVPDKGRSPRMRGKQDQAVAEAIEAGSIPAHAG